VDGGYGYRKLYSILPVSTNKESTLSCFEGPSVIPYGGVSVVCRTREFCQPIWPNWLWLLITMARVTGWDETT
jgi:hypothetical protein